MTGRETGREKCLNAAKEAVMRNKNRPESTLKSIAELWSSYLSILFGIDFYFAPEQVAHMMALMKVARILHEHETEDSYIDACGYLSLAYECEFEED